MKYFTIFLILTVLVNAADDCTKTVAHCTTCNVCDNTVCTKCDEANHYVLDSTNKCVCNELSDPQYSEYENACVECDSGCTSGCSTKGKNHCDSTCDIKHVWVGKDSEGEDVYKCEKCDVNCAQGCSTKGKKKCDATCDSGYSLRTKAKDSSISDEEDYTCVECDKNCAKIGTTTDFGCSEKGAKKCDKVCEPRYTLDTKSTDSKAYTCQACDLHCTKCDTNGAGFCDPNGDDNDYCDEGWVLDRSTKKCVQCDLNCVDGCKAVTKGEGATKCHATCKAGYYVPTTGDNVHTCQPCIENCDKCLPASPAKCEECKKGYTYNPGKEENEKNQCVKIDCNPIDVNCAICTGPNRNALKCEECKDNYAPEADYVYQKDEEDPRNRCIEKAKSIECTIKSETEGVEDEKKIS